MLQGIFEMNKNYGEDLHYLFQLVTINPARAVNLGEELGSIAEGKKADLLVIEQMDDGFPIITSTMVDGKLIMQTNYR